MFKNQISHYEFGFHAFPKRLEILGYRPRILIAWSWIQAVPFRRDMKSRFSTVATSLLSSPLQSQRGVTTYHHMWPLFCRLSSNEEFLFSYLLGTDQFFHSTQFSLQRGETRD